MKVRISIYSRYTYSATKLYVEYDKGISISKKGQQMSKSTKSTKYAHPEFLLPKTR
jgi:hypothetical protein